MTEKKYPKIKLELKPLETESPESVRIYEIAREATEHLNSYLFDFIETIQILKENKNEFMENKEKKKAKEIDEHLQYIENKIATVVESMHKIADEMAFLVDIKDHMEE